MSPHLVIRHARKRAGITQNELARRIGCSQAAIAKLERVGSNPTVHRLDETLAHLGFRLELRPVRHRPNVDETLIARNLRLSPERRLDAFETGHAELDELRSLMPGRRGDAG